MQDLKHSDPRPGAGDFFWMIYGIRYFICIIKKNETMKKIMLTLMIVGMAVSGFAQANKEQKPKTITVSGTAEMEITPDIIYISIGLKEYMKDKNNKVTMATLEEQLRKAVQQAGIPAENLTINDIDGEQSWRRKKKDVDFMAEKDFTLKVSNLTKLNSIVNAIDDGGLEDINIQGYTHSKMDEYRREVKVKALQAAKSKAKDMLEGIDEKLGGVMEVTEEPVNVFYPAAAVANVSLYEVRNKAANNAGADTNIGFKTIKVTADVRAIFSIQ